MPGPRAKTPPPKFAAIIAITLAVAACATDSGISVCRAKTEKELAAERQASLHESLADSYQVTHDAYWSRYHEEMGQRERLNAARESNFWADVVFAIFGNCDR